MDAEEDRAVIARQALEFQRLWLAYQVDEANAQWDAADAVVDSWARAGRAAELLYPMLDDERTAVRYAAAVYCVRRCPSEHAWNVIIEVNESQGRSNLAFRAVTRLLLMENGRQGPSTKLSRPGFDGDVEHPED